MAVVRLIVSDSKISIASITDKTGLSRRTIDRVIVTLKDKGILIREGAKNNATWIINKYVGSQSASFETDEDRLSFLVRIPCHEG